MNAEIGYWYTLIFLRIPVLALRDHTLRDHNAFISKCRNSISKCLNSFLKLAESALRASPARSGYPGDFNTGTHPYM